MPSAKPFNKEQILRAMRATLSIRAAARYLGCSYQHLKPFMKLYRVDDNDPNSPTLFDVHMNRKGKGIPKYLSKKNKAIDVKKIFFEGIGWESFDVNKIKLRGIAEGFLKEECCKCGFTERRVTDYKMPLLLNFRDKNKNNYLLENLELVCYNCYFLYVGEPLTTDQTRQMESNQEVLAKTFTWESEIDNTMLDNMEALGIDVS
jgi:hypothetical protein